MKLFFKLLFSALLFFSTIGIKAQQFETADMALTTQQKSLVVISALTAAGDLAPLKTELHIGLDAGLTINEIKEALVQLYAYCGFPRSLNAINTFKTVVDERKALGKTDQLGKDIIANNKVEDKYEQGRKTLEELSKTTQPKPAQGYGEFAPRIDQFLKEHLFADIFASDVLSYQQREMVTIAALSTINGLEAQLQSHVNVGKNTGISIPQLVNIADLIESYISKTQANSLRKIIGIAPVAILDNQLMIRISEVEINSEDLPSYKAILQDEAVKSVKLEAGVIAIFPMFVKEYPTQFKIVEIYANREAYELHLQTPHFKYYKTNTLKMVKSLKLIDMETIDRETMLAIFKKIK